MKNLDTLAAAMRRTRRRARTQRSNFPVRFGARDPRAPGRVFRQAQRVRRLERRTRTKRLFEIHALDDLAHEIVESVVQRAHARRVELTLDRDAKTYSAEARRTRQRSGAVERRLVLAMRVQRQRIATLRIFGAAARDVAGLRAFVDECARALGATLGTSPRATPDPLRQALFESLPETCFVSVDPDGTIVEFIGGAADLEPILAPFVSRSLHDMANEGVLGLTATAVHDILEQARRDGRTEVESTLRAAPNRLDVQLVFVTSPDDDALLCTVRDLTEVKAIERALLRRNRELSIAAERLKEVDVLKNEFMSNVSHELRTPLTAIIAYAEAILLTKPNAKTQEEFLGVICEQGHKLQKLISGLLDIAKLDSLATELKLVRGSLNDIIESAVVTVRPVADKSQIRIHLDLDPGLPLVFLDELRSQQIVWNLLTNAIKFSPQHSRIEVRTWMDDGRVWASVVDEGPGIAPEHQALVFEKFVQVDGSSTRKHGGVGLGLDLVRHLVELHGGDVQVRSALGEGSTFVFNIPVEKRRRPRVPLDTPVPSTSESS